MGVTLNANELDYFEKSMDLFGYSGYRFLLRGLIWLGTCLIWVCIMAPLVIFMTFIGNILSEDVKFDANSIFEKIALPSYSGHPQNYI